MIETFLKVPVSQAPDGSRIIESSLVREGNKRNYSYVIKTQVEQRGQIIDKKRTISAYEYIAMESQRCPESNQLKYTRLCMIDHGMYFIIDYFENVIGKPLTCIIQVNTEELKKAEAGSLKLPSYLDFGEVITDKDEFKKSTMARKNYNP